MDGRSPGERGSRRARLARSPSPQCHPNCAVCSSTDPRDHRTRPSIVVSYHGANILVDTTPELRLQAVRERLDRVDAVVYTHAHADHIFGLDDVRRYNTVTGKPLPLYAAPDTMATLRSAFAYAFALVLVLKIVLVIFITTVCVVEGTL